MCQSRSGLALAVLLVFGCLAVEASAQNTGGVFGPVVRDGHRSMQFRTAFVPDTDAFAQRLHYEQSVDSTFMWRIIGQARKTDDSDFDFDFVQGELFWDLSGDERRWQTGIRFDARIRDQGRPASIGVNWMNQFAFSPEWQGRFAVLTAIDVGEDGRDGVLLQTRANIYRTFSGGVVTGFELFSAYGTTADFASGDEQLHEFGPFVALPMGSDWSLFAGTLFGLTNATPDSEYRLWVSRSL